MLHPREFGCEALQQEPPPQGLLRHKLLHTKCKHIVQLLQLCLKENGLSTQAHSAAMYSFYQHAAVVGLSTPLLMVEQ